MSLIERSPREDETAGPGFAAAGADLAALTAAYAVLVQRKKPRQAFSSDDEISVVFFSYAFAGRYVHLKQLTRCGSLIEIAYRGEPYVEKHLSMGLALIPLGKLPSGKYRVHMVQQPMAEKFIKWGFKQQEKEWGRRFVCKSFSFTVNDADSE